MLSKVCKKTATQPEEGRRRGREGGRERRRGKKGEDWRLEA
jgi:hypothetical protein